MASKKHNLGQYFTTHPALKEKVFEFILNRPSIILEPSIGQGDLVKYIAERMPGTAVDMYEIDPSIHLLEGIDKDQIIYGDFMLQSIANKYQTIVGNPPYIRTKKGNLYIDFVEKCYHLLADDGGELVFVVPSDFLKLTSAAKLLDAMIATGSFTHIFHPNNERMFENASIDVIVFRYCKKSKTETPFDNRVLYNGKPLHIINSSGLITFAEEEGGAGAGALFQEYFDICVGLVSGKEEVYKHAELGNISVLNAEDRIDRYIYIEQYPCDNPSINEYLLLHKTALIERKIRKFNEANWFEWGAPRNIGTIRANIGANCIYICNLTRTPKVAFLGKVGYFGGGLIMLMPKKMCDLEKIVPYINSNRFKGNFMFSGRFKIGHRQISNSRIPSEFL